MKLREAEIIFINANKLLSEKDRKEHWQYRWHKKFKNSKLINVHIQENLAANDNNQNNIDELTDLLANTQKPVVIIAHSYAVQIFLNLLPCIKTELSTKIVGAFLVAPAMHNKNNRYNKLDFPSFLISSSDNPHYKINEAEALSKSLGSFFLNAGECQTIDNNSGHGPWPEGLLVFSQFINQLSC